MDQRTTLQPLEWRSSKRQTITREEEEQSYIVTEIVTRCSHCGKKFSSSSKYRYTLPHHHIFYFASQIFCFSQKAVLWQSRIKQVCWRHFSNSVDSLCVSMPLLAILAIFQTFAFYYCIFLQWSEISDLWCYLILIYTGKKIFMCLISILTLLGWSGSKRLISPRYVCLQVVVVLFKLVTVM